MEKRYIGEENTSTFKRILEVYKRVFIAHPWVITSTTLIYVLVLSSVWLTRSPTRLALFRSMFRSQPDLELAINPTERYQLVEDKALVIKRIEISSKGQPLGRVKVNVRAPSEVEGIRYDLSPQVSCQLARFGPTEGVLLFEIRCPEFAEGQRMSLALFTQRRIEGKGTVAVEIVGSTISGKFVGTSGAGSMD